MSVGLVLGGRYQLRSSLGHGGFGTVWKAHDRTLGRDVAIKLINMDAIGAGDREEVAHRFFREARAVAGLNHPNVVTAHDYGVQDDTAYLVMELIPGGSLEDEMRASRGPLGIERAVVVGVQVCAGLAAAHAAGLVHRDLKPANVMNATANDLVKIVDFGIARVADQSKITHTGSYLGTLRYTSPEQMGAAPVDARSDLYSLGCMLFELMAGRSPYEAQTPVQWIAAHQYAVPAALSALVPDVPPALQGLVDRLLAKSAADRPVNADAVRNALIEIHGQLSSGTRSGSVRPLSGATTRPPLNTGPTVLDTGGGAAGDVPYGAVQPGSGAPVSPGPGAGRPGFAGPGPASGGRAGQAPHPAVNPYPYPVLTPPPYFVPGQPLGGMLPVGWPGSGYPQTPPPPPQALIIGVWLLRASGLLAILLAALNATGSGAVNRAWHAAYDHITTPGANTNGAGLFVYILLGAVQAFFAVLIGRTLLRGSHSGRVTAICFVALVDIGCCAAGALPVTFAQPQSADFKAGTSQLAIDAANHTFTKLFPQWLSISSAVVCIVGALMLLGALILIVAPTSSSFFRAWRGRMRMPTPIRMPGM